MRHILLAAALLAAVPAQAQSPHHWGREQRHEWHAQQRAQREAIEQQREDWLAEEAERERQF